MAYVIRKVTSSIGRGRGSAQSPGYKPSGNSYRNITLSPFTWLNQPDIPIEESSCIIDSAGTFFIDEEYKNLGLKEGWLKRTGYIYNGEDGIIWTFEHLT